MMMIQILPRTVIQDRNILQVQSMTYSPIMNAARDRRPTARRPWAENRIRFFILN